MSSTPSKAGTPGKSTAPDPAIDDAKAAKLAKTKASEKALRDTLLTAVRVVIVTLSLITSFQIRLFAVREYGRIIHEFDPWFNFRATQYLADNGWNRFSTWFDYMSWYPLGRPVGTTIYPGMQVTAVSIFNALKALGSNYAMSLNDVCVFLPARLRRRRLACIVAGGLACGAGSPGSANWRAFTAALRPHVGRTRRTYHAIRRGGLRQRVHSPSPPCALTFFVVDADRVAYRTEPGAIGFARGGGVRVHGRRVGRVHLRFEHRAIKNNDKFSGCTVHYVTEKLDSGKIIIQKKVKILAKDNAISLAKKVLKQEHKLYPAAIKKIFN